jgi:hypothetical protein
MNYLKINAAIKRICMMFAAITMLTAMPAHAQIKTVDPNSAIGEDNNPQSQTPPVSSDGIEPDAGQTPPVNQDGVPTDPVPGGDVVTDPNVPPAPPSDGKTYQQDDLIGAAEGVFGKGAKGLAGLIEKILKKQGEPNAYIVGREGGGAFVVGLRYGSGTMYHKVEGEQPAYWTGPSVGFDAGANAGSTFILVYNLYDSEDLYKRFPSAEGVAYLVGGFNASYLRRGDVVLIPIRVGAGLRLGANVGYMKFSKKQRWVPF